MRYDFYTNTHGFRQIEYTEAKELEVGDEIAICVYMPISNKMEFVNAIVVSPMFWNSNADYPDWEVETNIGFVNIDDIYEVVEL